MAELEYGDDGYLTAESYHAAVAASGHDFYQTDTGHSICANCDLIPFDDDAAEPCPNRKD